MAVTYDCVTEPLLAEIIEILRDPKNDLINILPPVKPKEGDCYVFRTDTGSSKWFWRCDQYSWKNCNKWNLKDMGVCKTYFKARTAEFPNGDERFMKIEYTLTEESAGFVFVWYQGDSSIGEVTVHGNSRKNNRPHIRNAPIVKPKVIAEESRLQAPKALYNKLTGIPAGSGLEAVVKPRNTEQVRNLQKVEKRKQRLSHDALFNAYQLSLHLPEFIRYFRLAPNLNVRLVSQEIMEHFDDAILAASPENPVQLLVDTTFNLGDFYTTVAHFRCSAFVDDPVIPLGFLLHENKWTEDHLDFLSHLLRLSGEFRNYPQNVVFISDREFDFSNLFPNSKHVYCWIHLLDNVERWLKTNVFSTQEQRDKYNADVRRLMKARSLRKFHKRYEELKVHWDRAFLQYFDTHIKLVIEERTGRWVLEPLGLYSPYSGITTNAAESFNAVIKRWQTWKEMPVDCMILAMRRLMDHYGREIERGFYMLGDFRLKENVQSRGRPDQCPKRDVIHANQIIDFIRAESLKPQMIGDGEHEHDEHEKQQPTSVEALAREVVVKNQLSFVPEQGVYVVKGDEGVFTVNLGSPERCSCGGKDCYHLGAARLSIGKSITREKKIRSVNMTLMHRRNRGRRRQGTKKPPRNASGNKTMLVANNSELIHSVSQTPKAKKRKEYGSDVDDISENRSKKGKLSAVLEEEEDNGNDESKCMINPVSPISHSQVADNENGVVLLTSTPKRVEIDEADELANWQESPEKERSVDNAKDVMETVQQRLSKQFPEVFLGQGKIETGANRAFVTLLQMPDERWVCLRFDGVSKFTVYSSYFINVAEYVDGGDVLFIEESCSKFTSASVKEFTVSGCSKAMGTAEESGMLATAIAVDHCLNKPPTKTLYRAGEELQQHFDYCMANGEFESFPLDDKGKQWKRIQRKVKLYCICRRPYSITEELIECSGCKDWFHRSCVDAPQDAWESTSVPFYCDFCSKLKDDDDISLPQWGGTVKVGRKQITLANTCTIDNFLAILRYADVKSGGSLKQQLMQCEGQYRIIGGMLELMEANKFSEAKYEWAKVIGLTPISGVLDFYGSLNRFWVQAFEVFSYSSACSSRECDLGDIDHQENFSLVRFVGETGTLQEIMDKYTLEYTRSCDELPSQSGHTYDLTRNCRGVRTFCSKSFITSVPFLSIDVNGIVADIDHLPRNLKMMGKDYRLIGAVFHKPGHFVGVLIDGDNCRNYDGFRSHSSETGTLSCAVYMNL